MAFVAVGALLASATIASIALQRREKDRGAARSAQGEERELPPAPLLRGALSSVRTEDALELRDPSGRTVLEALPDAFVREAGTLHQAPVVEVVEKACQDPCNAHTRLVAWREGAAVVVLDAEGTVKLEDLDRDGIPEALLDHRMDGTAETVTLPLAYDGDRFFGEYRRFPEGVDRQLEALSRAAEIDCDDSVSTGCQADLRAILGLSAFRGADLGRVIAALRVGEHARGWARTQEEAVESEVAALK